MPAYLLRNSRDLSTVTTSIARNNLQNSTIWIADLMRKRGFGSRHADLIYFGAILLGYLGKNVKFMIPYYLQGIIIVLIIWWKCVICFYSIRSHNAHSFHVIWHSQLIFSYALKSTKSSSTYSAHFVNILGPRKHVHLKCTCSLLKRCCYRFFLIKHS